MTKWEREWEREWEKLVGAIHIVLFGPLRKTNQLLDLVTLAHLFVHRPKLGLQNLYQLGDELLLRQRYSRFEWFQGQVCILADSATDKYFAARNSHHLASFFIELTCRCAHDTNIRHLHLSAAVGTSSPMNANRPVDSYKILELLCNRLCMDFCLNQSQPTELRTSTTDCISFNETRVRLKSRLLPKRILFQHGTDLIIVNIRKDEVLFHGQSDLASRVFISQISDLTTFLGRQTASGDQHTYPGFSLLRLLVHSQQLPPLERLSRRRLGVLYLHSTIIRFNFLDHSLLEILHTILLHKPQQTRLLSILPLALVPENAQNCLAQRHDRLPLCRDPHVSGHRFGDTLDGHVSTQSKIEPHDARLGVCTRYETDVVDVRVGVIVPTSRNGDVELTRQVPPHGVAPRAGNGIKTNKIVDRIAELTGVDHLEIVDTR
mmetsp:Transcript_14821/g.22478  ORF Transcript_14821/g.22478 Transcript_14821/m.22478 type:complete len:433 (-) Transcript_14821:639-1937(-)